MSNLKFGVIMDPIERIDIDKDTTFVMMLEAEAVGKELGVTFRVDVETRIGWAADVGARKTSMLQDLESGRPMELESVVGVVIEMGEKLGLPMPYTRTLYSCAKLLGQVRNG